MFSFEGRLNLHFVDLIQTSARFISSMVGHVLSWPETSVPPSLDFSRLSGIKLELDFSPLSWVEKFELASLLGVRQFSVSLLSSLTF